MRFLHLNIASLHLSNIFFLALLDAVADRGLDVFWNLYFISIPISIFISIPNRDLPSLTPSTVNTVAQTN
jgi:hypothetical protein